MSEKTRNPQEDLGTEQAAGNDKPLYERVKDWQAEDERQLRRREVLAAIGATALGVGYVAGQQAGDLEGEADDELLLGALATSLTELKSKSAYFSGPTSAFDPAQLAAGQLGIVPDDFGMAVKGEDGTMEVPGMGASDNKAKPSHFESLSTEDLDTDFLHQTGPRGNLRRKVWTRRNVEPTPTRSYEPTVIYEGSPQILTGETNVFKMWVRDKEGAGASVYYYESADGLDFTAYSGNPVFDPGTIGQPFVHHSSFDNTYYLYYSGGSAFPRYSSSDGISWTQDSASTLAASGSGWDSGTLGNLYVWQEGASDWKMVYEANPSGSSNWRLGVATSTDGLSWSKRSANPIFSTIGGGGPFVHKMTDVDSNTKYVLWFHGGQLPTDVYRAVCYDTNLDNWHLEAKNPVFPRREIIEGVIEDGGQIGDPHLVEANGSSYLYYEAVETQPNADHHGIQVATSDLSLDEITRTPENFGFDPFRAATVGDSTFLPATAFQPENTTNVTMATIGDPAPEHAAAPYWAFPDNSEEFVGTLTQVPRPPPSTRFDDIRAFVYFAMDSATSGDVRILTRLQNIRAGDAIQANLGEVNGQNITVPSAAKQVRVVGAQLQLSDYRSDGVQRLSFVREGGAAADTASGDLWFFGIELSYHDPAWWSESFNQ